MVAGASHGLGLAVAEALAAEGARVAIGARDEAALAAAGKKLEVLNPGGVLTGRVDVRVAAEIERWHRAVVDRWGGIDLLVTNSGGPPPGSFATLDDPAWQSAFDLLVLSAIRLVRTVLPSMKGRGDASILLMTSSSVKQPIANLTLSNVLRASVAALAKTLARELAGEGIRVNHLVPGRIATDRLVELDLANARRAGITVEEQQKRALATIPLSRYGKPRELAAAATFLLSSAASYITGATLQVDGGLISSVL